MSRKSKSKQNQLVTARIYAFLVVDSRTNQRVVVAAPVFYQLLRRGWVTQSRVEQRRDQQTGAAIEERLAVLVDRLSFRALQTAPDGNLCFRSLLLSEGVSIDSSWRRIEREWILAGFPYSVCPQTWEEKLAQQQARQEAIRAECSNWGVPEPEAVQTGLYLSPEAAAQAIVERQR